MKDWLYSKGRSSARWIAEGVRTSGLGTRWIGLGHWLHNKVPLILLASAGFGWAPQHSYWRWVSTAFTMAFLYFLFASINHSGVLCEKCMAGFPLDGAEQAAAKRKRLFGYHFKMKNFFIPWGILWVVTLGGSFAGMPMWGVEAVQSFGALLMAFWIWHYGNTHRRLELWCPWCRRNRPPEDETVPDPDPSEKQPA